MENNYKEFLQVQGEYSMRNLTILITIVTATIIVLYLAYLNELGWEMFAAYLCAGGGVYSFGKYQDDKTIRSQINVDAEPSPTNIDAEQVDVKGGKVTVNQRKRKR